MKGLQYITPARAAFLEEFEYHEAKTVEQVRSLLDKYEETAQILAGGTALIPLLRARRVHPEHLVNVMGIPKLDCVSQAGENVRIGSLVSLSALEELSLIQERFPVIFEAIRSTATIQIRNMCTVGGNLGATKYGSLFGSIDLTPVLVILNTTVNILTPNSEKMVSLEKIYFGSKKFMIKPDEFINEIRIPIPKENIGASYLRAGRVSEDRVPKVNVAVLVAMSNGSCENIKIAGTAPSVYRATEAEEFLKGKILKDETLEEAAEMVAKKIRPISDMRSTPEYRIEIARVLTKRGIKIAMERAKFGRGM